MGPRISAVLAVGALGCEPGIFRLEIDDRAEGLIWVLETEGGLEARALGVTEAEGFDRIVGAGDRATVLEYEGDLRGHQIEPGPIGFAAEGRPLPPPDRMHAFDPDRAEWIDLETLPDRLDELRIPAFDHRACAEARGCLAGLGDYCVMPCPPPSAIAAPDPAAPPAPPRDVPGEPPPDLRCAGDRVQWFGSDRCVPMDDCPPSGFRSDLPAGAIRIPSGPAAAIVRAASPGSTIALGPSRFTEDLFVPSGVHVVGSCTASTAVHLVHLDEGSSLSHLAVELTVVVDELATGVAIESVAVTSTVTAFNLLGDAELDRVVVRGSENGVAVRRTATIRDSVIEGSGRGVFVLDGLARIERVAVRRSSSSGLEARNGAIELARQISLDGASDFAVRLQTSTASVGDITIAGADVALEALTSSATLFRARVRGTSMTSRVDGDVRLIDTDWSARGGGARTELQLLAGRLDVKRSRIHSPTIGSLDVKGGDLYLRDVEITGAGVIIDPGFLDAERVAVVECQAGCFVVEANGRANVRDLVVAANGPSAFAMIVNGRLDARRLDVTNRSTEREAVALRMAGEDLSHSIIAIDSLVLRGSVGLTIDRRLEELVLTRAFLATEHVALSVEEQSTLSASDVEVAAPNRIGVDTDSGCKVTLARFRLGGGGDAGVAVRGTANEIGIVDPLPIRGVFLHDGSIGPYMFGVEISTTGVDPADLIDRVTFESRQAISAE